MTAIDGVAIYPVIALFMFFAVFILMLVWVLRLDKKHVEGLSYLPFEKSSNEEANCGSENG